MAWVGTQTYSYDAAGNTLSDGERSYTYDARNRMTAADLYEYGYNALGQRVFKPRLMEENPFEPGDPEPEPDPPCDPREESCEDPPPPPDPPPPDLMSFSAGSTGVLVQVGWLLFQYDDAGRLIGEYDELGNAVRQYVWLDDMPIAMLNADGIHYLHTDHLNTPRTATDGLGQVTWSANPRPFGDEVAPGGALEMPLRFPGQYHDRETGLHHNWHREYLPAIGRYSQSDPIGLIDGHNLYGYVLNRPTMLIDPTGEFSVFPPEMTDAFFQSIDDANDAGYYDCLFQCLGGKAFAPAFSFFGGELITRIADQRGLPEFAGRQYHTRWRADKRFTAGGWSSKIMVPRTAATIRRWGRGISAASAIVFYKQTYDCAKECLQCSGY